MISLLPSEGLCQACYLLAFAGRLDQAPSVEEWVARAKRIPAGHAYCPNLAGVAESLFSAGIARREAGRVYLVDSFPESSVADRASKLRIAKALLIHQRPAWLPPSGSVSAVFPHLVPQADLVALGWLGEDLIHILADLLIPPGKDEVASKLGRLGELIVIAVERQRGRAVTHVSEISDSYGYDVESRAGTSILRLEVKCTVDSRAGVFFLSRHEYEQALKHSSEWMLVQVVLSGAAIWTQTTLDQSAIIAIKSLGVETLQREIVKDAPACTWNDSVAFELGSAKWSDFDILLPSDWKITNPLKPQS